MGLQKKNPKSKMTATYLLSLINYGESNFILAFVIRFLAFNLPNFKLGSIL